MTLYRSPDSDSAGAEPSYAGLAARLKKLKTYEHPNAQALLDKLAAGEMDSEECLLELTKDAIQRTQQAQQEKKNREANTTQQQQQLEQQRQRVDEEMDGNATSDEPTVVDAEPADDDTPRPAAAPASAPVYSKPGASSQSGLQQPPQPGSFADTGLSGSSGSYEVDDAGSFMSGSPGSMDLDDERDDRFED